MANIALTRQQSREVDRLAMEVYGFSGLVLMENAGRGVADCLEGLGIEGPVVICCGRGNNGGDGYVIARHLDLRGFSVRVLLYCDPGQLTGDAAANFRILEKTDVPIYFCYPDPGLESLSTHLADAAWIVDAPSGDGGQGGASPALGFGDRAPECCRDSPSGRRRSQRAGLRHRPAGTSHRACRPHLHVCDGKDGFFPAVRPALPRPAPRSRHRHASQTG